MPSAPTPTGRPARKTTRPRRGEGQWALGYREPLNKNEEIKKNDDGLNVRKRIIDIYSKQGFDSIDLPTCADDSAGTDSTPSAPRGSTAVRQRCWSPRSSTTATS